MCGIAGVLELKGARPDRAAVERMVASIRHRGPDEQNVVTFDACALGHARLSIVDPEGGQQPMSTEDGALCVVFNGEIFNHVELRAELEKKGHRFRTHCDTEVILALYAEYGERCVESMNGQWAFAIWDTQKNRLFLSRDRIGVRPLFYHSDGERFAFASEIKAILGLSHVARSIDPLALDDVLTLWTVVPPKTPFSGVSELPPGHSLVVEGNDRRLSRHFELSYPKAAEREPSEWASELFERLLEATRLRFQRADVPVGAYVSGGLDSAVVAGLVRRFTEAPIETFSVGFESNEFDEGSYQADVVRELDVRHHRVLCTEQDIANVFPDVLWHAEQPLVRTAPAPMFLLAKLVRESGYKVVLTGEGSDEMLGGYDIFKEAKVRRFLSRQPKSACRGLLVRRLYPYLPALQKQPLDGLTSFFQARSEDLENPFFSHLPRWELTSPIKALFSTDLREHLRDRSVQGELTRALPAHFAELPSFCQAQYLESSYLLPGYILSAQGDRMAMAHGVEGRYPFLDPNVVALAASIPVPLKMFGLNEKYILKLAMADLVPPSVKQRPKQPYRAPDARSFYDDDGRARAAYVDDLLSESALRAGRLFDPARVLTLVNKVRKRRATSVRDNMAFVAVLSSQLLHEQFVKGFGRIDR
jgi:asparagine synthase (glutamine-hydrolysing)